MPRRRHGRRCITSKEKLNLLQVIDDQQTVEGRSFRAACAAVGVEPAQVRRWKKQKQEISRSNPNASSVHRGRVSFLTDVEEEILFWFFELRERGMKISVRMVMLKACELVPEFRLKTDRSKDQVVRRFLKCHDIVHRVVTHESQRSPHEVQDQALQWIAMIRPMVSSMNRDKRYVMNMDQTPVFFSMSDGTTLEVEGSRTVNARSSCGSTMRVSVAVTITASGEVLPTFIVFKGKPNGRIAQREFASYPNGSFYACQERAWMDETVMLQWVEQVLRPHVEQNVPAGIHPILLLDSYRCHMMASVVNRIADLGVEVQHIPGGCTGLCQPIDVGIGKPLKSNIRHKWEEWMLEVGVDSAVSRPPMRGQLSQWIVGLLEELSQETIQNSWRHGEYSFFSPTVDDEEAEDEETEVEEERQGGGASIEEVGPEVDSFALGSLPDTRQFVANLLSATTAGQEHKGAVVMLKTTCRHH
jgi:transposase-like protein